MMHMTDLNIFLHSFLVHTAGKYVVNTHFRDLSTFILLETIACRLWL